MRDTDSDWNEVARKFPYWGVISVDRFKKETLSKEDLDEFFLSGENYLNGVINIVKRNFTRDFQISRGLDFGCGVGRLAIPMARAASDEVVGVDVSDEMLRLCAENAKKMNVNNLRLVKGDDVLSGVVGKFNFVNSYIVLQHIPQSRGYNLISKLLGCVISEGICSLQFTYAKEAKFFDHEKSKAGYYRREGNNLIELKTTQDLRAKGAITMYDYDLNSIFALIQEVSHPLMSVRMTNDDGHLGLHVILKKKPDVK